MYDNPYKSPQWVAISEQYYALLCDIKKYPVQDCRDKTFRKMVAQINKLYRQKIALERSFKDEGN